MFTHHPKILWLACAAWLALEAILAALRGRSMQNPASELRRIPLPRLYEKSSNTGEPPRHEANHGSIYQRLAARTQPLVVLTHPPLLGDPSECPLDGLLANDKFCMSRQARLSLSHSRRPNPTRRQTDENNDPRTYPPAGITRHGGDDETSVARTPGSSGTPGWEATLGPGVPGNPTLEPRKRTSPRSGCERKGGVP